MKKFLLPIIAAMTLVGMVGCNKGEAPETKTEWTTEELAIMTGDEGVLMGALPFYKAKFEVGFDEENGVLTLTSKRAATAKDVEDYCAVLEQAEYEEIDVSEDFFAELDEVKQYTKAYGDLVANDVVAVGLDGTTLMVYATCYLVYFGLTPDGVISNDPANGYSFATFGAYALNWMGQMYGVQNITGKMPLPTFADTAGYWTMNEYTYAYPWTFGNICSEEFMVAFDMYLVGGTEAEMNNLVTTINALGYAPQAKEGYTIFQRTTEEGVFTIIVDGYYEEFMKVTSDETFRPGYVVSYAFIPAAPVEA